MSDSRDFLPFYVLFHHDLADLNAFTTDMNLTVQYGSIVQRACMRVIVCVLLWDYISQRNVKFDQPHLSEKVTHSFYGICWIHAQVSLRITDFKSQKRSSEALDFA